MSHVLCVQHKRSGSLAWPLAVEKRHLKHLTIFMAQLRFSTVRRTGCVSAFLGSLLEDHKLITTSLGSRWICWLLLISWVFTSLYFVWVATSKHSSFLAESLCTWSHTLVGYWVISSCAAQMCQKSFSPLQYIWHISRCLSCGLHLKCPLYTQNSWYDDLINALAVSQEPYPENLCIFPVSTNPKRSWRGSSRTLSVQNSVLPCLGSNICSL